MGMMIRPSTTDASAISYLFYQERTAFSLQLLTRPLTVVASSAHG